MLQALLPPLDVLRLLALWIAPARGNVWYTAARASAQMAKQLEQCAKRKHRTILYTTADWELKRLGKGLGGPGGPGIVCELAMCPRSDEGQTSSL